MGNEEARRRAIEMIEFFQAECRRQCEPYLKILADLEAHKPRVFIIDGNSLIPDIGVTKPEAEAMQKNPPFCAPNSNKDNGRAG